MDEDCLLEILEHADYWTVISIKLLSTYHDHLIDTAFWNKRYQNKQRIIEDDNVKYVDRLDNNYLESVIKHSSLKIFKTMLDWPGIRRHEVMEIIGQCDNGPTAQIFFDTGDYKDYDGDSHEIFTTIFGQKDFGPNVTQVIENHDYYDPKFLD